jgi:hypothetical protein
MYYRSGFAYVKASGRRGSLIGTSGVPLAFAKKNARKTINIPNPPTKCPTIGMKLNGPAFGMTKKVMSNQ